MATDSAMNVHSATNGNSTPNGHSTPSGHSNPNGHSTPNGHHSVPTNGHSESNRNSAPIAIVGMACRFGGDATSPSKLWELCTSGKDSWSPIPAERFDVKSWYHPDNQKPGKSHVLGGYFLKEDVALFDAAFFNLSGDVAAAFDPQMRLLLETVYEATEDAGIPIDRLAGSNTSMFTGIFSKDYHEQQVKDPECLSSYFIGGVGSAMLSNRISHFYDLQGASMSIDTGCSAGLVALHQACQSIRSGASDVSIIGAASTMLHQDSFIAMSSMSALGAEGKCFAWDARAQGYGRGEGVATFVLKPLSAALRDGDRVHAVVRESGLNQDGKTPTISSPSMEAQIKLIEDCYKRAGLNISETGYVEAHMTGTAAGDPIEAEALARTFGKSRAFDDPILVGSIKTNLGHTEPVSGLAAVIKAAFALKKGVIPPNLNYEVTNPKIPIKEWHLHVPTVLTQWPENKPLRASVNNFGYGGTNAHIILELAPAPIPKPPTNGNGNGNYADPNRSRVYILSAKDSTAAKQMANRFAAHLRESITGRDLPISLDDLAYTLSERRSAFHWMTAVRASNLEELCERLESPVTKALHSTRRPRLGFVFNGQGAQWYAMGRELIDAYPVFGSKISEADRILKEYGATWSLYDELMRDKKSTRVSEINLGQAMTVAVQLCLVDLLESWGITPSAVTSHSSGEIAAAYAVRALSFKQALGAVYYRGEVALKHQKISSLQGGMLAAGLSATAAEQYIANTTNGRAIVACINSPNSVTLSGDSAAIDEVMSRLEKDGVFARKLNVPLAYHSHHMMHMAKDYTDLLEGILSDNKWNSSIIFSSPVTGGLVTSAKALSASHWTRNLTSPVLFSQSFETMCFGPEGTNVDMIVEIGAHSTLSGPIRQILKARSTEMPYVSCLKRPIDAVETMQELACELLARGYPVALESVNSPLGAETHTFVADLPTYPWNHTTRYWTEPRIAKEQRNKRFPPHELLGNALAGSNGSTPTWRNFLKLSDVEWLGDHQVDSKIVFPGAGYISMAIEATRLLTDASEETIRGYRLRDIDIMNALVIPESSAGVEVQLCLRRCGEKELEHTGWYEFEICSLGTGYSWVQHCKGYVSAETGDQIKVATTYEPEPPSQHSYLAAAKDGAEVTEIEVQSLFAVLRDMGINHGPSFQNLIDSHAAGGRAVTNITIAKIASEVHNYVVHPTTLDSIFQATYSSLPENAGKDSMVLPRSIRTLFVPQTLKRQGGDKLGVFTELVKANKRGCTSNIAVVNQGGDDSEQSPSFFQMYDFYGQAIPRDSDDGNPDAVGICSKSVWERDILHNVPEAVKDSMKTTLDEAQADIERKCIRASYHFFDDAIRELGSELQDTWQWHHKVFHGWMKSIIALGKSGKLGPGSQTWSKATKGMKQMLADELMGGDASCRLLVRIGQKITPIVRGEIMPLELMMEDDLLNQYYMDHAVAKRTSKHAAIIAELYAVKQPGANILEIGAGTGGATTRVLEAFGAKGKELGLGGSLVGQYTFTDISSGFFSAARQKLAAWEGMVDYKVLDIEQDPIAQSFPEGQYDLIVAAMVLHATKNLHKTMTNVRKLLKPDGKLLLIETTQDRLDAQLIFGTLPGWWLAEEPDRRMSPNASIKTWDRVLRESGFSGVDLEIRDCEDPELQSCSSILSSAVTNDRKWGPISIVYDTAPPPKEWLSQLQDQIKHFTGFSPSVENLDEVKVQDKLCIFVAEIECPFLDGIDETGFEKLRNLLVNSRGVLWLSGGSLVDAKLPAFAPIQGLMRTLRLEDTSKRYVHLDFECNLEGKDVWTSDKIDHIVHVLRTSFDESLETASIEREYAVKDSMLRVPRLYPNKIQDSICSDKRVDPEPEPQLFHQPGRPLVWETSGSGLLSDLRFVDKPELLGAVPSGLIEIEAKAFGLNFRDVMLALGQLDETLIGHECAGIVTRLGPNTEQSGLRVGDRVCGLPLGRFASRAHAYWTSVVKMPDDMSFEDAASIPLIYITAYHSLVHIARMQKGESVLIHAATGGVGQAAIVLAQHIGAEVFATCSTQAKRDFLIEQYHISPDHILSSRDASFATAIMTMTNGKGVDVVVNSLSGPLLKATWDCIARFGRFVEIGKVDLEAGRHIETTPFARCAMYAGVDILQLGTYRGDLTQEALVESVRICHERHTTPVAPIVSYPITDMEKAMRHMQAGTHMGKLVLVPGDGDKVNVLSRLQPISLDDANATYFIAGGLGGIGRKIAEWMMEKGAKNMVLVSRHATSHANAQQLVAQGKASGCNVHIRDCDLADENSLIECLANCSRTMPPVRGVINAAMVLDDTVLERMTFEQWRHAVLPKINSSRNIDKYMPNLSFYVMLSSITGVAGNLSQANYGAGNTFQDTLARHRTAKGKAAVALDLGVVLSAGFVADREEAGDDFVRVRFEKQGFASVDIPNVLRLVEDAIRNPLRTSDESQVIIGITEKTEAAWALLGMPRDRRVGTLQIARPRGNEQQGSSAASGANSSAVLARALSSTDITLLEAAALIVDAVVAKVADVFNIPSEEIDPSLPLARYGIDSLVAVELRNWLSSSIKAKVSVFEILQSASILEFGELLATKSDFMASKVVAAA